MRRAGEAKAAPARVRKRGTGPHHINLALQGGGAHGAFTWGVAERLLEEEDIEIAAISGSSAGAMNGAAIKSGLAKGGRQAALDNLNWLWRQMGAITDMRFAAWWQPYWPEAGAVSDLLSNSVHYAMADVASRMTSPYNYGPFYRNPLRRIAERFEYDKVCADEGPRLFVGATNVRTGKIRVFTGHEVSAEAIMASACLPTIFRAVEIEDPETGRMEAYWDGGYSGNPALFPLFEPDLPQDIIVVNINPLVRDAVPTQPTEILNRINEISFNSSLLRELRAIGFVQELIESGHVAEEAMKYVLVHMIADDELMTSLSEATKLVPTAPVLDTLKKAGRARAEAFLLAHRDDLGVRSTVDLPEMFG